MAEEEAYTLRRAEHDVKGRFGRIQTALLDKCGNVPIQIYGKKLESRRISCVFLFNVNGKADAKSRGFSYNDTPTFMGEDAPKDVLEIKEYIEKRDGVKLDYVLCHIYRGVTTRETSKGSLTRAGQDYIGLHNDKEALKSEIYSISFGAPRRFRFHPIDQKNVVHESYTLRDGDEIHMHGPREGKHKGCQLIYKHYVPPMSVKDLQAYIQDKGYSLPKGRQTYDRLTTTIVENEIPPDRINLTFRQYNP